MGQFGRSISSQQNGDNACPPNITYAHVGTEGLFSWVNRPSVAAGSGPSPSSVKQLLELSKAAQHKPICEPGYVGPPAPSETAAQFFASADVPAAYACLHLARSHYFTQYCTQHRTADGRMRNTHKCCTLSADKCLQLRTHGSRATLQEKLAATQNAANRNEDVSRFMLSVANCQHDKCA